MSWNEVKIGLAPIGARIYESRDRSTTTTDGYPVTVLTVSPPDPFAEAPVKAVNVEAWLTARDFQVVTKKPQSSRFRSKEIEVLVVREADSLTEVILNLQVDLDVRKRLEIWARFVRELCESHHLRLIDPSVGLVDPEAFERLVMGSFAWECFLKREAHEKAN